MGRGSIAILPSSRVKIRSRDVEYAYRQDSDFQYLTGFAEPESVAILVPGRASGEYLLFCRERNKLRETWDGYRAGPKRAISLHGADDAFPITDINDILPGLIEQCDRIYYTMGVYPDFDQQLIGWVTTLRNKSGSSAHRPDEFISLDHPLHDFRLYKSRAEVSAMRSAARITAKAHKRAMNVCQPGLFEYEIEAEFLHEFHRNGVCAAYPSIVGSGANSCTLHYTGNNRQMQDGDLLLVDAGCEYNYYAADVTRTYPVNGKFTEPQRAIYDVVLDAHQAAIECVEPGRMWNEPHDAAVRVVTQGLKRLGLLKGPLAKLLRTEASKKFFMHRTGHWLGMDVHDVGDYKVADQWRVLEPGMVMTVEPGIYIPPGTRGVAKRWQGIGIRIEDDVLVTRDGCDILTKDLPRDADAIESLVGATLRSS